MFRLSFVPQPGTCIPVDGVIAYLSHLEKITERQDLLHHLQSEPALLSEVGMREELYGLVFVLGQPFPHRLIVLAKETEQAGLLDLVEVVNGTNYEGVLCGLLCLYAIFPRPQAYWIWKSQQGRFARLCPFCSVFGIEPQPIEDDFSRQQACMGKVPACKACYSVTQWVNWTPNDLRAVMAEVDAKLIAWNNQPQEKKEPLRVSPQFQAMLDRLLPEK